MVLLVCLMAGCLWGCSNKKAIEEQNGGKTISSGQSGNEQSSEQGTSKEKSDKKHNIEVIDDKGIIKKCPKSAKTGAKVVIKTYSFMDAISEIIVNGNDIGEWDKNKTTYTFIMPDEDVRITTTIKNSGWE